MRKYRGVIIWTFVLWCSATTYWYIIVHNKLNFANQSEIIDNRILEILLIISISFILGYLLRQSTTSIPIPRSIKEITQSVKDDLKVVEGIGPAIEKLLNKEGIHTYWQLAETQKDKLVEMLTKAGPLYLNHGEGTWAEQAALLRDGKLEEFKKLTSQLIGGNRIP